MVLVHILYIPRASVHRQITVSNAIPSLKVFAEIEEHAMNSNLTSSYGNHKLVNAQLLASLLVVFYTYAMTSQQNKTRKRKLQRSVAQRRRRAVATATGEDTTDSDIRTRRGENQRNRRTRLNAQERASLRTRDTAARSDQRQNETRQQRYDRRMADRRVTRQATVQATAVQRNARRLANSQSHQRSRLNRLHQEASNAVPTEWDYTRDELYTHLHQESLLRKCIDNGDVDAALATDFEFDPYKAAALWYTNSGYDRYDRLLKFDASPEQWGESDIQQHYNGIEDEVRKEILTDENLHCTLKDFEEKREWGQQNLPACSACGIRKLKKSNDFFVERKLDALPDFMKLNDFELCELKQLQRQVKIPVDANFTVRSVDVSKAVSWYRRREGGDYYHLHPELVAEKVGGVFVHLCPSCDADMFQAAVRPRYSIAKGVDFGCYHRLGLETPNIHDIAIIARIRRYGKIVKIRPSSSGQRNYTRDQLTTHMTMFEHDAPYIAAKLFYCDKAELRQYITEALHLHFMDAEGNLDNLTYVTYQTTTILGRCYVVYQWLQVLTIINRQYYDVELPPYDVFLKIFEDALDDIVNASTVTTDKEDIVRDLAAGSDVAGARAAHAFTPDGTQGRATAPLASPQAPQPQINVRLRRSTRRRLATTVTHSFVTEADFASKEAPDKSLLNATLLQDIQIAAFADDLVPPVQQNDTGLLDPDGSFCGTSDDDSTLSDSGDLDDSRSVEFDDDNDNQNESILNNLFNNAHSAGNSFAASDDTDVGSSTIGTSVRTVRGSETDQSTAAGQDEDPIVDPNVSHRQHGPLNEYTHGEFILCGSFPNVFLLGKAYKRWAADLHEGELEHLMSQFTNVPAQDRPMLFYIADALRRNAAAKGMETRVKGDRTSLKRFADMVKDPNFEKDLSEAILKPTGPRAKAILKKFLPILNVAGRHIPHGAVSSSIILQKVMEISRRFASPFMMLTMSPSDLDNPTALQMSVHSTDNKTFPAMLQRLNNETGVTEDLDLREYMREEMTLHGTGSIQPISFQRDNRAKVAADNPIAYMKEYKELLVDILSTLVGLPPCDMKSTRTNIANRRTKNYRTRKAGLFGTVLAYYGVNECHQKGTMHFHLALYGGIGADILQKYSGVQGICDAITAALDSQYQAKLPAKLHMHKIVKDSLASVAPGLCPDYLMSTRHTNCTLLCTPVDTQLDATNVAAMAGMQVVCKQIHKHTFTCYKGFNGLTGCRGCMPRSTVPATAPVLLEAATLYSPEGEAIETFQITQQGDLPPPDFSNTQSVLDVPDQRLVVWELQRPSLEGSLPPAITGGNEEQRSEMQLANLELLNNEKFNAFLATLDKPTLDSLYKEVCRRLEGANGMVVDYSPGFAYATGSHHNTAFLGASEQGKSAIFYISSYFGKNKAKVEETLSILRNCIHHVAKFPSTAPITARHPSGTDIRTAQHILTRTMNQATVRMGLSDCQAAAIIIDLKVEISSEIFSFCKPYNHIAYAEWDRASATMDENSDRDFEAYNDFQDQLERNAHATAQDASDGGSFISEHDDQRGLSNPHLQSGSLNAGCPGTAGRSHASEPSAHSTSDDSYARVYAQHATLQDSNDDDVSTIGSAQFSAPCESGDDASADGGLSPGSSVSTELVHPLFQAHHRPTSIAPEMFSSFGPARTFVVDQQQSKKKVAVPYTYHYRFRGELLKHLNRFEYQALVIICDRDKKKDPDTPRLTNMGRPKTPVFPFGTGHPLQGSHVQCLRSKQTTLICSGKAPKPPGNKPADDVSTKARERWQVKASAFAKYYLVMFRVLDSVYDSTCSDTADYDWDTFTVWKNSMEQDPSLIARFRLQSMYNHMWGLYTPFKSKKLLSKYRSRSRTIWSQEQHDRFATEQWLENAARDADNEQTEEEFQRDHDRLSTRSITAIKKTTLDDRAQLAQLQHSTKSLLDTFAANITTPNLHLPRIPYSTRANSHDIYEGDICPLDIAVLHDDIHRHSNKVEEEPEQEAEPPDVSRAAHASNDLSDHIQETRSRLTGKQASIFDAYVAGFADAAKMPKNVLVTGAPGTGKTFLINAIRSLGHHASTTGDVISTSYNGIAAIAAGGNTICGLAKPNFSKQDADPVPAQNGNSHTDELKVYSIKDLSDKKLKEFMDDIRSETVVLLVIDEISTVPPLILYTLHRRCCQAKGNDLPFGGIPVLSVGDFSQLGPVRATSLPNAMVEMARHDAARQQQLDELRGLFPAGPGDPAVRVPPKRNRRAESLYDSAHPFRQGCELLQGARWLKLTDQIRTDDPKHMELLRTMECGNQLKVSDFRPYKLLSKEDYSDASAGWINAPILVATNRERYTITAHMTSVFAKAFGKYVIRWPARHRQWEQAPKSKFHSTVMKDDGAFWEYYVQDADGFITDTVNKPLKMVNATRVRYHSLSFDNHDQEEYVRLQTASLPPGSTITLTEPPHSINVVLVDEELEDADDDAYSASEQANRAAERAANILSWSDRTLVKDRIVVPLIRKRYKSKRWDTVPIPSGRGYSESRLQISYHFPVELGFSITVHKSQSRTLRKVIIALSMHAQALSNLTYASVYVAMSRVKKGEHIRLLLHDRGQTERWNSLLYLRHLRPDKYIKPFFEGFGTDAVGNWDRWDAQRAVTSYNENNGAAGRRPL